MNDIDAKLHPSTDMRGCFSAVCAWILLLLFLNGACTGGYGCSPRAGVEHIGDVAGSTAKHAADAFKVPVYEQKP